MSAIAGSSALNTSSLSAADYAGEPAAIRTGNSAAKSAYSEGLAFEEVLLNEVTQEMAKTADDDSDGLGGSDSSDASTGSDALSNSAESIDPALKNASATSEKSAS
jgi:hypothetical protein